MGKRREIRIIYIYAYQNKINGMVYVGQTIDLIQRDKAHISQNEIDFDQEIDKYGRHNFDFWTFAITYSEYEADQEEIFWIAEMRKQLGREMVYNKSDGGNTNGMLGRKHTPETRQKMRLVKLGTKPSLKAREKMRLAKLGRTNVPHSQETIQKMRSAAIGRINSPEATQKMCKTKKANRSLYLFSVEQEIAICQRYLLGGITKKQLAKKYECSEGAIYRIIKEHK